MQQRARHEVAVTYGPEKGKFVAPTLYRMAVSFETLVYRLMGLVAERRLGDPFGDDPLAGPLTLAIDAPAHADAVWPQAS